ncbi:autotransporter domain-containing protein [Achromobacter sp. Marseille-Q0513]|uniref:autotransporter domain-containing protein n=1 Tax=Achromobacter sp. Marseille-Q0513 TaxID=2829161 RepID=UPI001B8DD546|nr:autotransporter domain-containing protein [Achromobacter sp. Marseille-Q0513]MBR8651812.1 autotransporter domain-containing protein [Achromobacter sp. Marseille-Q0513]
MHLPCRPPLRLSALSLAVAVCFAAAPDGAQAQKILRGGGNGAGLNGTISGLGGIGGGGGGSGGGNNKGGDAAQTLDGAPQAGSGPAGGAAGSRGGLSDITSGGGGGGDGPSGLGSTGGRGGSGNVNSQRFYYMTADLAGTPGEEPYLAPGNSAGGGGGGAGIVLLGPNVEAETNAHHIRGGNGGGTELFNDTYLGNGGGGGAALVMAQGGYLVITGNSTIRGGNGGQSNSVLAGGSGGSGGAGVFLYDGGTMYLNRGRVEGGDGGAGPTAGMAGDGVLSNQGQVINDGIINGGFAAHASLNAASAGSAGVRTWGGAIRNNASALILGGPGGTTGLSRPGVTTGDGGAGIVFQAGLPASLSNSGTIEGGVSGQDLAGTGLRGRGGVGVVGAASGRISIVNSGIIRGGLTGQSLRGNAIELYGSDNRLELGASSNIIGNVVVAAGGANNVLALGGESGLGTFDVSRIGADRIYQGFDVYEKLGNGTWTLTGVGNQDWRVKQGIITGNSQSIAGNVRFATASGATLVMDESVSGIYNGTISGDGTLAKTGRGDLILTGANTHTGGTSVLDGTLALGARGQAGSVTGAIDVNTRLEIYNTDNSGLTRVTTTAGVGTAYFYADANAGAAQVVNNNLMGFYERSSAGNADLRNLGQLHFIMNSSAGAATINNSSWIQFLGNATGGSAAFTNTPGARVDFGYSAGPAGDGRLTVGSLAGDGTFFLGGNELTITGDASTVVSGIIADGGDSGRTGGSLVKAGSGTLTLQGANTYSGATTVRGGILSAGSADAFRSSSGLKVESGGTFDIGGHDVTVQGLSGAGTVTNLGSVNRTLTVDDARDASFSGALADSPQAFLALTKRGAGTLVVTGSNTYAGHARGERGHTSIYGGTLQFGDGAARSANRLGGDVFVHEGGSLAIGGTTMVDVANDVNLIGGIGAGATLSITANANGPSLTADRVLVGANTTFNLGGIDGARVQDRLLIDTRSGIQGDFTTVNIGGSANAVDYLSASTYKSADGRQYLATYVLSWTAGNDRAQGAFTLADAGNRFTVGAALSDQAANAITGWDGKSLTKAGPGTLVLTGANTYTGGTTIASGTLQLGDGGNSGSIIGNVANHGTLVFKRGDAITHGGDISGDGALRQLGSGATTLTGNNTSPGGTPVESGALRAGGANAFAARTAYTINGGTLDLNNHDLTVSALSGSGGAVALGTATLTIDQAIDTAYAGALTGSGELVKLGAGTLTLAGRSAMNLKLAGGALVTSAQALGGNAALAAGTSLTLNQASDAVYGGQLSGAGKLLKLGAGKLELTGDSSAYTGATTLQAGTLAVNGRLGGALTVGPAGRLQGNGGIGHAVIDGTVAPGNSIGALNVAGDIVFNPGSTYEVEIDATGRSDRIAATGAATLNGGAVQVLAGAGDYAGNTRYTILTAKGGLAGAFGGATTNLAFLSPTLDYDASNAYLTMRRNQVAFQNVGETRNQTAAGAASESLGLGNTLYGAVLNLSAPQARAAFDQLSGEAYASVKTTLIEDGRYLRDAINARLRDASDGGGQAGATGVVYEDGQARPAPAGGDRAALWAQAFGAWAQTRGNGNAARLGRSTGGFFAGADAPVSQHWRLGALAGYSRTSFDVKDRRSSGSSDNYHLGLYAGARWDRLALRAGASHTWHDLSARRDVDFPGYSDRLKSGYRAGASQVFGELGYQLRAGNAVFEPYANLAHVKLRTHGHTEQGGAAALKAAPGSTDITFGTLGLRAAHGFELKGAPLTVRGMAGWRHAFGDVAPQATMRYASGGADYTVGGVPLARNIAVVEAGLDYAAASRATIGLAYNGQLGAGLGDHAVKATFNLRF